MEVYGRWVDLFGSLVTKYNDGYVKDEKGSPEEVGYPDDWLKTVHRLNAEEHRLPVWEDEAMETELPY